MLLILSNTLYDICMVWIARKWGRGENSTVEMIRQAEDSLEAGASGISVFSLSALDENDIRELGAFKRANMG